MATILLARTNQRATPRMRARPTVCHKQEQPTDDPRLAERVTRALQNTRYGCLSEVRVAAFGSYVVLHGRLPNFYVKQFALATVRAVPGVGQICDVVEVARSEPVVQKAAS